MTFTYPVIMTRREDGSWEGEFPDLEMCRCHGASLAEALEDARAQAYNWIDLELQEEQPVMPYVSDIEDLTLKEGQQAHRIMFHYRLYDGWDE